MKEGWPVTGEDVTIWQFETIDFYSVIVLTLDRNLMSMVLQGLSHLAHCPDLLKQFLFCTTLLFFQIDALSKRSKASETAFLSIYKKLVDVPGRNY